MCLPLSNATVERLFSIMGVIKNRLRNCLAIPMVEGVLATRYGVERHGELCSNITILPKIMQSFTYCMYDHKSASKPVPACGNKVEEEEAN